MTSSLRNIGGALAMGVSWAAGGAIVSLPMEALDPHGAIVDVWIAALAYPAWASVAYLRFAARPPRRVAC